ncbi:MAG: hypothetical protein KJO38_02045 [Gammaproteobacteria bacterium]|nr:hypothetical protein [Gammaproteobacteria bacterium]
MTDAPSGARRAPLEELMVAMDVVDTIRHRELVVERELDAAGRRERLIERLREIYTAQGIAVTDAALAAGVDALEQERFAYQPPPEDGMAWLARLYVRRDRWAKPLLAVVGILIIAWTLWYVGVQLPEAQRRAELPAQVEATHLRIISVSASADATQRADELRRLADDAAQAGKLDTAEQRLGELQGLLGELESTYEIRVVSRPNELSGVWRVPDVNPNARNYYLIVEAVDARGSVLTRPVRNEEDGRIHRVTSWGVRVSEATFEAVAADKRDDGIIQDFVLGSKKPGQLTPEYRVPTSGATITEW